ncbi:MAG: hypothetical protein MdMp014T_3048 [Treponematales bacterium]
MLAKKWNDQTNWLARKMSGVALAFVTGTALLLAGCTSGADRKAGNAAASAKARTRPALIDDSGSLMGIGTPPWLAAYIQGGNMAVEALKDYKGKTCFVITTTDESKDFALNWVNGTEGPRQVAAKIANTVSADIASSLESAKSEDTEANVQAAVHVLNNAVFSGLTRNADWWQQIRYPDEREEYRAYALYVIDKKTLDNQVAAFIQRFLDDRNRAISEAEKSIYQGLIASLLEGHGVNLSAGEPEQDLPDVNVNIGVLN